MREVPPIDAAIVERAVVEALRTCCDPEIPVDIYELGLIHKVAVAPTGRSMSPGR